MSRRKEIFLAFAGQPIEQPELIFEIQDGYECWDLKKFTLDNFVSALKNKIPPVNDNVLCNYKCNQRGRNGFGITEKEYQDCSWGLLIPDGLNDALNYSYANIIFLLNLYSPTFLYPLFYAYDLGIICQSYDKVISDVVQYQNQAEIFKKKEFVSFFQILLPQGRYGTLSSNLLQGWGEEDWRLFTAGWLYSGLKDYDNSKNIFGWQRESADMASILEALFTADSGQNQEVGYRLRKGMASLLTWKFPTIEKDIKDLYSRRSEFVHGQFFKQIAQKMEHNHTDLPLPDFKLLYKQKEYVRFALVACLYLAKLIQEKPAEYKNCEKVINVLEQSIIDMELRKDIISKVQSLFLLMPETDFEVF